MYYHPRISKDESSSTEAGRKQIQRGLLAYFKLTILFVLTFLIAAAGPIGGPTGIASAAAQEAAPPPTGAGAYSRLSAEQLGRVVAPIALYPDSLVAQILAASTFPSQIVEADQWLKAHPGLSQSELAAQGDKQPWDPSVKALLQFPSVLDNLSSNLGWTSELGDGYYNQPKDVMKSVQAMRKKAKKAGNLKPTSQLNVNDKGGDILIEPADPNIVYVPAYDPWIVYGYPILPWPDWVDIPGIWWDGPGGYFGVGFGIAPFLGFGWGWHAWGLDWHHYGLLYNYDPYVGRGPSFFDRRAYYSGRPGASRPALSDRNTYRGFTQTRGAAGTRTGPFSGFDHGGNVRGFSGRGQSSFGGFRGGGFAGGGFGGGGFHGGGGRR